MRALYFLSVFVVVFSFIEGKRFQAKWKRRQSKKVGPNWQVANLVNQKRSKACFDKVCLNKCYSLACLDCKEKCKDEEKKLDAVFKQYHELDSS